MSLTTSRVVSNNPTGSIWTKSFWKGASERAIKTAAQAFVGAFLVDGTTDAVAGAGLTDMNAWGTAGLVALASAVLSLVMSIANPQFVAGVREVETVTVPAATDGVDAGVAGVSAGDVAVALGSSVGEHAAVPSAETLEAEVAAITRTGSSKIGG